MQLTDMLKRCEHFFKPNQYAFTCMNGMGHVEKLLKYFKPEKLVAGTALVATVLNGPGDVDFIGKRGAGSMNLANYTEKPDDFTHALVAELEKAQFNPNLTTNFRGTLMAKVVFNSVVNTLCTMFEVTMGEYADYEGADEMSRQLIDEAYDVCERDGVKMINTRQEELDSVNYVSKVANPLHYPSMYQDMHNYRPTEVDYINGYLVKLGQKHNYNAKTHAFLTTKCTWLNVGSSVNSNGCKLQRNKPKPLNHSISLYQSKKRQPFTGCLFVCIHLTQSELFCV